MLRLRKPCSLPDSTSALRSRPLARSRQPPLFCCPRLCRESVMGLAISAEMEAPGAAHGGFSTRGADSPSPLRDGCYVGLEFCPYAPENTRNSLDIVKGDDYVNAECNNLEEENQQSEENTRNSLDIVKGDDYVNAECNNLEEENQQSEERNEESVLWDKETHSRDFTTRDRSKTSLDQILPALDGGSDKYEHLEEEHKRLKEENKLLIERNHKFMEGLMSRIRVQAELIESFTRD